MTGPVEPSRPDADVEPRATTPGDQPSRPAPTGWPGRPDPRLPGSAAATGSLGAATVVPDKVRRPAPRPVSRPGSARGRKAKLAVKRLDPWSVFVTSLLLSLLLAVATIIAAFLLYAVLSGLGVPQSIN